MVLLPKRVLFPQQGLELASNQVLTGYRRGLKQVVVDGREHNVEFCQEVETILRKNFPIADVTGTKNKLTITFKQPNSQQI